MKRMYRLTCLLLALLMGLSCAVASAEGQTYPKQWDLSEIYASADEWMADYERVQELIQGHSEYRGRLNTAEAILEYYERFYMGELTDIQNRLYLYAQLGYSLDPSDPTYNWMLAMLSQQTSEELQLSAFVTPEIYAMPLDKRREVFSAPELAPYAYALSEFTDPDHVPLGEEAQSALAILGPSLGRAGAVYSVLNDVELPSPTITAPDGSELTLTDETYAQIVYGDVYDRDFKGECNRVVLTKYKPFANTFASLLDSAASLAWSSAQLDNYASTRESAMAAEDIDPAIYDMMIAAAHEGAADYQRYLDAHSRALGLDVQYPFDMAQYASEYDPGLIEFDQAVDDVRNALGILGEDYIAIYDEMVSSAHIDVYPGDNKTSGAFSMAMGDEYMPYILLNYMSASADVSTIAHEMGHSIYSCMSARAQNPLYGEPVTFTQEVASTTNELIYYTYKMQNAADDEEKLYYLEEALGMFSGTFFIQALYAEFEDSIYQTIESGGALDAEALSDTWYSLYEQYRGDSVKAFPDSRYQWAGIPHFYSPYYVYKYATSVCYAASLCKAITEEQPGALEGYLELLSLGSSAAPAELLSVAGVDPLDKATYDEALAYFGALVDEYERLIAARA